LKKLVMMYRKQPIPGFDVRTRKHLHLLLQKKTGCSKF
jgi:hypothetical protein